MPTLLGRTYQLQELQALWAPVYEGVLNLTGGTLMPFGDPNHGQPNGASFTSIGDEQVTWEWGGGPPASFDTPLTLTESSGFQGLVPILSLNGTDEEADTPDAAWASFDDAGGANGFTMLWWLNMASGGARVLAAKWNQNVADEEWIVQMETNAVNLYIQDDSVPTNCNRLTDAALDLNVWVQLGVVYNGAGGATAANGITWYTNGAVFASTATNSGTYVGMEDQASKPSLFHRIGSGGSAERFYDGKIAGGPCGPIISTTQLTADQMKRYFQLTRPLMGV